VSLLVTKIPFLRPCPARLSELGDELAEIENSGLFSNYGPVNTRLEQNFVDRMFGGEGACLTVCNATIGLMLALKQAADSRPDKARRYAIMPSFTFAATAQAALWAGLVPIFCDIDEQTWIASPEAEEEMLRRLGDDVAVVMPYATFGNGFDLARYDRITEDYGVPVVIDAAASLGTLNDDGTASGAGSRHAVVYSMHVTKTFSTSEGGLIYSTDKDLVRTLRTMGNFGFGEPRMATMPGLNSKLSEVAALLASQKLSGFDAVAQHRAMLAGVYRAELSGWTFQEMHGRRHAYQFMPVLLPEGVKRSDIMAGLAAHGVGAGHYFSPHLAEQPYFQKFGTNCDLRVTHRIAARILSLPMSDVMTPAQVSMVCATLQDCVRRVT
jgi:dTDP-4-amino-4,6-dideoxygalactose transaminase